MTALTLRSPAKLNLGLAITGKRSDGFHDLVTIFQTIDLCDTVALSVPDSPSEPSWTKLVCTDVPLPTHDNLIYRAVAATRAETGCTLPIEIKLRKSIPIAAGLGGASSNAATTLIGLDRLWDLRLPTGTLESMAAELGSDVPFFIRGGCALGTGRGEKLRPVPLPDSWFVVVYPRMDLPFAKKTAEMFRALQPEDFSTGDEVIAQASRLDAGMAIDPALLGNGFGRPLYALVPKLRDVNSALREAGADHVSITGAGPTHYATVATEHEAIQIARVFGSVYKGDADVFVCRSRTN